MEKVYRHFYIGSKIISGRCALESLSFELMQQEARHPLCLIPDTDTASEKIIIAALKSTITTPAAICICNENEKKLPETVMKVFKEVNADSFLVVSKPFLMYAAKNAWIRLSYNEKIFQSGNTAIPLNHSDKHRSIPFFVIAIPSAEITYFPDHLPVESKWVLSANLFSDTVFIDPRILKRASTRKEWKLTAAASLISSILALSDTGSHPAARACAGAALQQICEAIRTRCTYEKIRLICNAQILSKTALVNSRPFAEIEILFFFPVSDTRKIEMLNFIFRKNFPLFSFSDEEAVRTLLLLNEGTDSEQEGSSLTDEFCFRIQALLDFLIPPAKEQFVSEEILQQTNEAICSSGLPDSRKTDCLRLLESFFGDRK